MTQATYTIANAVVGTFLPDLNNHLDAIVDHNSGSSAPGTTFAGMFWADTTGTPYIINVNDDANTPTFFPFMDTDGNMTPLALTPTGDFTFGVGGVDKTWNKWLPATMWWVDTAGAMTLTTFAAGDVLMPTIPFDKDSQEFINCQVMLPADYDGSALTFEVFWSESAGTTGSTVWIIWSSTAQDNDSLNQVVGATNFSADAFQANLDLYIVSKSITPTGASTGDRILTLRFGRNATSGSDTFDADALFLGMNVSYT